MLLDTKTAPVHHYRSCLVKEEKDEMEGEIPVEPWLTMRDTNLLS